MFFVVFLSNTRNMADHPRSFIVWVFTVSQSPFFFMSKCTSLDFSGYSGYTCALSFKVVLDTVYNPKAITLSRFTFRSIIGLLPRFHQSLVANVSSAVKGATIGGVLLCSVQPINSVVIVMNSMIFFMKIRCWL